MPPAWYRPPESVEEEEDNEAELAAERKAALEKFGALIKTQLAPALHAAQQRHVALSAERSEYSSLRERLLNLSHSFDNSGNDTGDKVDREERTEKRRRPVKMLVDIGSSVSVQATVPDLSRVCVHVGFGFHPELTPDEAVSFIGERLALLDVRIERAADECAEIVGRIASVEDGMRSLASMS